MGKAIEKIALTKEYKIHSIVNCQSDLKKIDLSTLLMITYLTHFK